MEELFEELKHHELECLWFTAESVKSNTNGIES